MRHLMTVAITAAACLGIVVRGAVAQTAKDLVGTWILESDTSTTPDGRTTQPFGPNPQGVAIFDSSGPSSRGGKRRMPLGCRRTELLAHVAGLGAPRYTRCGGLKGHGR
jgi:hypothetical protein